MRRRCSGNATTALAFQTSTVSAAMANVGTMHESGQTDPNGPEDKRQPRSVVTTDWYTASDDIVPIVYLVEPNSGPASVTVRVLLTVNDV